jgi:hypothetical protein
MDMFTHPDYQGLGLIREVTTRVFRDAHARGIAMWYVTPSDKSYPIFVDKLRYLETGRVNYRVCIFDYAEVLASLVKPRIVGKGIGTLMNAAPAFFTRVDAGGTFETVSEGEFGEETDELWSQCRSYGVVLVRDAAYMTWRYIDNPERYHVTKFYSAGSIRGILVTKYTRRRSLKVGEFVDCVAAPDDSEVRRAMYAYGLSEFREAGCAFAQNWAIEGSRWEREMVECGLAVRRKKVPLLFSPNPGQGNFHDIRCWYLTPGDGNDI